METDLFIPIFGLLYLAGLIAFLTFLGMIPRVWRVLTYTAFCAIHILAAGVFHSLNFVSRNSMSGLRTQTFFTVLQEQLSAGNFSAGLLDLPGCGSGILLSLLAVAAVLGGVICCWVKIRWYSYLILPAAFILSALLFAWPDAIDKQQDIEEHNALRRRTYALIAEKRARGVTARQMADAIGENLKEYHYSYENRKSEKESVAKILSALRNLTPPEKPKDSPSGKDQKSD